MIPTDTSLGVDVRPPEPTDGPNAVSGLVREHERDMEPPVDFPRYSEQRLVFLLGQDDAGRVLVRGRLQAPEARGSAPSTPKRSRADARKIAGDGFAAMADRRFADRRRTAMGAVGDEVGLWMGVVRSILTLSPLARIRTSSRRSGSLETTVLQSCVADGRADGGVRKDRH